MSDPNHAVFLSYASQDAAAANRIAAALRAAGVEVWLDQSELTGGDAWDRKIRSQIGACVLFAPVISANTQARREGYFRIEWKLAAQRTHAMADGTPFLLPIVIDATKDSEALVPEEFRAVQWTRLPDGETSAAFCSRVKNLLSTALPEVGPVADRAPGQPTSPSLRRPGRPGLQQKPPQSRPWLAPALIAVVAIVALALWQPWKTPSFPAAAQPRLDLPPAGLAKGDKSIAVLAFADLSADKGSEYFADGVSEELLDVLGKVPGLRVVGRTSSFSFKGKNAPAAEIAQRLGVAYLVDGSVARDGTKVRIAARLINASDGFQLWSDKFTRELTDIFKLQDEIAGLIAKNLSLKLGTSAPAKSVNPEVFRLYLEGRLEWNKRSPEGLANAQGLFEQALKLDPGFARAHSGLADVWTIRFTRSNQVSKTDSDYLARARKELDRALALDPNLAEVHATRGQMFYLSEDDEDDAAVAAFRRSLELNPNYATARHWFGRHLCGQGKFEAGLAELEMATRLDPLSPIIAREYALFLGTARRWPDLLAACDRALALQPADETTLLVKANALIGLNRPQEALAILRPLAKTDIGGDLLRWLIVQLAMAGDLVLAGELAQPFLADPTLISEGRGAAIWRARLYFALNQVEAGMAVFERADLTYLLRRPSSLLAPVYDQVRDDPRFLRKLEESGALPVYRAMWAEHLAWKKRTGQP